MFDQSNHVVTQIAEQTCCGLRKVFGQFDFAFGNQCTQAGKRIVVQRGETVGIKPCMTVDTRLCAVTLPDQVRLHSDDRITSTNFAAGHGFQHEGVFGGASQLEHQ